MATFPLLLTALLAAAPPAAPVRAPADLCEHVSALPDAGTCGNAPLCSPRQRVKLTCELRDVLESRYVFFPVKDQLLSKGERRFDARAHLDACVAAERAIAREDEPLRYYDRMRRCTAAFDDGHLMVSTPSKLPQVALGVGLRLVEGKVVIANVERKLVSFLKTVSGMRDLDAILAPGAEVVTVDGKPALERVGELARYLPASSDGARLERAVDALTRRDFAYPSRRHAALVVKGASSVRAVELPWWIAPEAQTNPLTRAYVRRTGMPTTELLTWRYDGVRDTWDREGSPALGYSRLDTILPARDAAALREYRDDADRIAVRLGEVVRRRDRAFCYLQILTFQAEALVGRDGRQPFTRVLEGFVSDCKEKELDLVLDLRQNGGGYLSHTSALLATLGEPAKSYPGGALVVRATTMNQLIYQQRSPVGAAPARPDDAMDPRHIAEAIGAAERARAAFTPAFLERPLQASAAVGGYTGRVVALVAPTCMSACDRVAALLQRSGRATLIGGPTEGAGGSQQETRSLPVRWSDPQGLLAVSLPNAAMGVQPALADAGPQAGTAGSERPSEEFFQLLTFENRPVMPDVTYATRLDDVLHQNRGWLERAEAALFEKPLEAGNTVASSPAGAAPAGTAALTREAPSKADAVAVSQ